MATKIFVVSPERTFKVILKSRYKFFISCLNLVHDLPASCIIEGIHVISQVGSRNFFQYEPEIRILFPISNFELNKK